ncbi:MAG TPA: dephospho-CoA kinase [Pseudonocardia sp.]|nr:dephospho-CoA kinase [Pseudonocardia sp.]
MLRVGLTGGIGAGKSTVAGRLVELGATLIDSDKLAREVVARGTPGLADVVAAFGEQVLDENGHLDRPALAQVVFGDNDARARLNAIVHPLVRGRTDELLREAPSDAVVIQDIPLLVEGQMASAFPLVIVVDADEEERVRRLVGSRGMPESDARARIAAQADDQARRAAADVWLDNSGAPDELIPRIDQLWRDRLVPFEQALRAGGPARVGALNLVPTDPSWPDQASRLARRVRWTAGEGVSGLDHVGSTSVAELDARDVLDLQLTISASASHDQLTTRLREGGFLPSGEPGLFESADPGRPAVVRVAGEQGSDHVDGRVIRDWLRDDAAARQEYLELKRRAAKTGDITEYAAIKATWFETISPRARRWADYSR